MINFPKCLTFPLRTNLKKTESTKTENSSEAKIWVLSLPCTLWDTDKREKKGKNEGVYSSAWMESDGAT